MMDRVVCNTVAGWVREGLTAKGHTLLRVEPGLEKNAVVLVVTTSRLPGLTVFFPVSLDLAAEVPHEMLVQMVDVNIGAIPGATATA